MKLSRKMVVTLAIGVMILLMPYASAQTATIPEGYSQDAPIGEVQTYNILKTNGKAEFVFYDPVTWELVSSTNVGFEVGGKIEMTILGFVGNIPYVDFTVYLKDGTKNASFANYSMADIAFILILNVGSVVPGFLSKNNWTEVVDGITAVANQPAGEAYSMNGTFTSKEDRKSITLDYKQNPNNGNQNTTLTYEKKTGLLLSADLAFGNYFLAFELKSSTIPGYPVAVTLTVSAMAMIVFFVKSKRKLE